MIGLTVLLLVLCTNARAQDIAYLAYTDGYWQVWSMRSDGSGGEQLTFNQSDTVFISWYPDGHSLLATDSVGELWRVDTLNKKSEKIELPLPGPRVGLQDASISPDGARILFSMSTADSVDDNNLWTVDADGKNPLKLTNMKGLQHSPVWGPDGQWIYFLNGPSVFHHDIWRYSLLTKKVESWIAGKLYHFEMAFSPAGRLTFSSNRSGNYEIWQQNEDQTVRQLTDNPANDGHPAWSPDGKTLAFDSTRSGRHQVWTLSMASQELHQLTDHPVGARFPVWKPRSVAP
jgi:Tol biopolymer transport system component